MFDPAIWQHSFTGGGVFSSLTVSNVVGVIFTTTSFGAWKVRVSPE